MAFSNSQDATDPQVMNARRRMMCACLYQKLQDVLCMCAVLSLQSLVTVRSQLAVTPALLPVDHSAPHTAATAAAIQAASTAHPHTDSSSSGSDVPVVVVTCSASDLTPHDIITPWCEAVVAAGVPRVMLVSDDAACAAAAKAAGVKVLQHKFEVGAWRQHTARACALSLHCCCLCQPV